MIDHAKTRSREVRLFPFAPSRLRVINNLSALLSRDMNDDPVSRSHSRQLPTPAAIAGAVLDTNLYTDD